METQGMAYLPNMFFAAMPTLFPINFQCGDAIRRNTSVYHTKSSIIDNYYGSFITASCEFTFPKLIPKSPYFQFEYPVVSAWRVGRTGDIKYVDLFGGTRTPEEKVYLPESPVLYIGMHNKQV